MSVEKATLSKSDTFVVAPSESIKLITDPVALAIWIYLLDRPDNWIIRTTQLKDRFEIGRDRVRKALTHLLNVGLLERKYLQDESGKMQGTDVIVHAIHRGPENQASGSTEGLKNRGPENPTVGKSGPLNNTKSLNNTDSNICKKSDSFKRFFAIYPENKKGGTDATAWKKAKALNLKDSDFQLMVADVEKRIKITPDWLTTYALGITRYLDQKFWLTPVQGKPETTDQPKSQGWS